MTFTDSGSSGDDRCILHRPPHEMPRASWQDTVPLYKAGPLSEEQVKTFYRDGVLVLPDFYAPDQIQACKADIEGLIEKLAQKLYQFKRISSLFADLEWTERLLQIAKEDPEAPIILIKQGVLPPAFWKMYSDPRMLDIAVQLGLNPEQGIALNPAWNIRAKMPRDENTVVPWHQDNSYWEPRVWDELILTVWVALVPTTQQNGCMQFIKGAHKAGTTSHHTIGSTTTTWYTELAEKDLPVSSDKSNIVNCEVSPGTAILFPGTTPHRSLNSTEQSVRWSTDFRLHNKTAQRAGKSDLDWFYGVKDSLLIRDSGNQNGNEGLQVDWDAWAGMDRTEAQNDKAGVEAPPEFDPIIVGPWMDLWDIEKHQDGSSRNIHVDRYVETVVEDKGANGKLVQGYKERNNW